MFLLLYPLLIRLLQLKLLVFRLLVLVVVRLVPLPLPLPLPLPPLLELLLWNGEREGEVHSRRWQRRGVGKTKAWGRQGSYLD